MKNKLAQLTDVRNLTFALFVVLAFSLAWNTAKVIQRNHGLQQEVDKLKDEISLLELQNENLRLGIEYQKTDAFLELKSREKFNKAAAGEHLLILPKRETNPQVGAQTHVVKPVEDKGSNLEQWYYFLFGGRS